MAQVLPMMEGRNFTTMGEPTTNTEYDIHAQSPEQGELSAEAAEGGVEQHLGHPAMTVEAGQYGEYGNTSYAAQVGGGATMPASQAGGYAGGGAYVDGGENSGGEHLQVDTSHVVGDEPAIYIEPSRLAQPLKLFIGQVPKNLIEEDLAFVFEPYGRILDLTVIRDRRSGNHRGCAFVTYENGEDAMKVAEDMHGKFKFDGAPWPAQVRPAAGEVDSMPLPNIISEIPLLHLALVGLEVSKSINLPK